MNASSAGRTRRALLLLLLAATPAAAQRAYEAHVLFDNSPSAVGYYHSRMNAVAPSFVEHVNGMFPVATDRFVSPPNALRLRWTSARGGDWQITLKDPGRDWRKFALRGDTLAFRVYSENEITAENSPRVFMQDFDDHGTRAEPLVDENGTIPARQWVRVKIPFGRQDPEIKGTNPPLFALRNAVSVTFMQGLDDGQVHTMWLDDFAVIDGDEIDDDAPAPPTELQAVAYERHVDLTWNSSPDPDVLAYRIHRSENGRDFRPVGTQRNVRSRYADYVGGEPGRTFHYRVSAVDLAGNESPWSAAASAQTRALTDDELLDMVQLACFRYYWEAAHPNAGMAPEILPGDENLIATGGNGFGIMALIVAIERGFVTREAAVARMLQIVRFLAAADRFHGAWPHFLDGNTGRVLPFFGIYDDGGDLVETAFVIQALLAARQYFERDTPEEREIRETATRLWHEVEWDWYRQPADSDVLTWHWSPEHGFHINHPLIGWNETLIVYLLAIASPTHPVPAALYHRGWAGTSLRHIRYRRGWGRTTEGEQFVNGGTYYGHELEVGVGNGAELFFTHFSFLGFDPRGIRDPYTNYFRNNRSIALINRAYCIENPRGFAGYGPDCWGRSAGVNSGGGRALPRDDNGTINCMAALASMPYTPEESLAALKHFYRHLGDRIWGTFGFHDGFNETLQWFDEDYMALNQGPIVVMIENHRTGLLWRLFMANAEIAPALEAIGFVADETP